MKISLARFAGLLIASLPAVSHANPNYFICKVATEESESTYRVTTDENKGEVTYEIMSNGNILKKPAIFTADSVVWGDPPRSDVRLQFTISRIDLSFRVDLFISGRVSQPRKGQCELMEAPVRAF